MNILVATRAGQNDMLVVPVQCRLDIYIDIADTFELEEEGMECFKSRIGTLPYFTDILCTWRGFEPGEKYAEPFL